MAGIIYSALKGLKNQIFCRPKFVRGSSTAAPPVVRSPKRTGEFELSQVNCKTYLVFVHPASPVLSDPSFNPYSFTVHGFRPVPRTRDQNSDFCLNVIDQVLISKLSPVWRALNRKSSLSFWEYQSAEQGGYQDVFALPHEYFFAVVSLFHKFNMQMLLRAVEEEGKGPTRHLFYAGYWWRGVSYESMCSRLRSLVGANPRLWIWVHSGMFFLREAEIVVSPELKPIDVPPRTFYYISGMKSWNTREKHEKTRTSLQIQCYYMKPFRRMCANNQ